MMERMLVSVKPCCLRKCLTESGFSGEATPAMCLEAVAAFCGENPHEVIKYSVMKLDLGGGWLSTEAEEKVNLRK